MHDIMETRMQSIPAAVGLLMTQALPLTVTADIAQLLHAVDLANFLWF